MAALFLAPWFSRPSGRAVRLGAALILLGALTLVGLFGGWLATEGLMRAERSHASLIPGPRTRQLPGQRARSFQRL